MELINEENHEHHSETDQLKQLTKRINLDIQHAKMIDFFITNKVYSYKIVEAESNYYDITLQQRMHVLGAHSIDVLTKSIILENTSFDKKYESKYYKQFYLAIVPYTSEFNAERIFRALKQIQNSNCTEILSNKYFHFRLAKNDVAYDMTGYRFNCITPFLMKAEDLQILFPKSLLDTYPQYFWIGGGEYELKVGISIADFFKLYNDRTYLVDLCQK